MVATTMTELACYLQDIQFRRRLLGGIEEDDVWAVIERMQTEFRGILKAEEQRHAKVLYDLQTMIQQQQDEISHLETALSQDRGQKTGADADG